MDVSKAVDQNYHAQALVGGFLQAWSFVENNLRDAIEAAMDLKGFTADIICANMQLHNKLNLLKTLVDITIFTEADKRSFIKLLEAIGGHATKRNMIAHDTFYHDEESGGVRFSTIKAKGKFDIPKIVWTESDFANEDKMLENYVDQLKILSARLIRDKRIMQVFSKQQETAHKDGIEQLNFLNPHSRSTQGLLNWIIDNAASEKDAQTPQIAEE